MITVSTIVKENYQIPVQLPVGMFRAYDIRGEVSEQGLNEHVAYGIGLAIGTEALALGQTEIVVACDARLTGPALKKALTVGILSTGAHVVDIGVGPSPMMYFATHYLPTSTGVMVTASHNPSHHNGFKIVLDGQTLSSDRIQQLLKRIQEKDFVSGAGNLRHIDIKEAYVDAICKNLSIKKPMKVVVDAGNGAASEIAPVVLKRLGCEVVELYCEYDGRFPNHHPDPTIEENLVDIKAVVKKEQADIGLAFDGDADRIGVVTNAGNTIWPDRQMILYAKDVLRKCPGEKIIFDVKCSRLLPLAIKKMGGQPIMYRTGHSILKAKMVEERAPLAGEMSGHIFFKEGWYGFDDGIYVGARLLSILSEEKDTVEAVFAALPKTVNTPELKLPVPEARKKEIMTALLASPVFDDADKNRIDGLRATWDFGWGLVRPSNTSPYLILRFEADTIEHLDDIKERFRRALLAIDDGLSLPF